MAELRGRMKSHVRAAKEWLTKAEQSLEQENEIQGNLNLMLARAELKRAQETKPVGKRSVSLKSLLIHSMLVAGITGLALMVGLGGFPIKESASAADFGTARLSRQPSAEAAPPVERVAAAVEPQPEALAAAVPTAPAAITPTVEAPQPAPDHEIGVTPAQMQELLRTAGKSLRGQTKEPPVQL